MADLILRIERQGDEIILSAGAGRIGDRLPIFQEVYPLKSGSDLSLRIPFESIEIARERHMKNNKRSIREPIATPVDTLEIESAPVGSILFGILGVSMLAVAIALGAF